jgi:L-aspartate oxidase
MLLSGSANVFLDLKSYISPKAITGLFPHIYAKCSKYGVDITRELVPVAPAAHYSCGGVFVDDWGKTTIRNLYAVGEVACTGLHGANRLASTSLLEGLVYGYRAGTYIQKEIKSIRMPDATEIPEWVNQGTGPADPALIAQDMGMIRNTMWNYVGLIRKTPLLERALHDLVSLEEEIEHFYRKTAVTDNLIGLRNMARTAILITEAAWKNKQSIGCHYRV